MRFLIIPVEEIVMAFSNGFDEGAGRILYLGAIVELEWATRLALVAKSPAFVCSGSVDTEFLSPVASPGGGAGQKTHEHENKQAEIHSLIHLPHATSSSDVGVTLRFKLR